MTREICIIIVSILVFALEYNCVISNDPKEETALAITVLMKMGMNQKMVLISLNQIENYGKLYYLTKGIMHKNGINNKELDDAIPSLSTIIKKIEDNPDNIRIF